MIVLKTGTLLQTITFAPRQYVESGKLIITSKRTRKPIEIACTFSEATNYLQATVSFDLLEGVRYSLQVLSDSDEVIYRDLIKCTDQVDYDIYDTQKGSYVEAETSDNEFVVINN